MGGVFNSVAAPDGQIFVNITRDIYDTFNDGWDGAIRETFNFTVTSDGATITGSLENAINTNDLTLLFSDGFSTFDTTPAATISLTPGTSTVPQLNYVFIDKATKTLQLSTGGFPTTEHAKVAIVALLDAARTQTDGALRNQNTNDHIKREGDNGHILHIAERVRQLNAEWDSGAETTLSGTPANVYFANTSGKVWQMHLQDFPAQDMALGDDIHVVNDPVTAYRTTTNLNDITVFSDGSAWNNEWSNIVVWGVCNKTGETSHLMVNLPSDGYTSEEDAFNDNENFADYTIPKDFKGVGFLLGRFTIRRSGANFTYNLSTGYLDLRGFVPNNTAGSGGGGPSGITEFTSLTDTPNSYAGFANQAATVTALEDGLEFSPVVLTVNGISPTLGNYNIVLSNNKVGENVTVSPQGSGTGTTFSVADNDSDPTNELQDLGNSKLNNDVTVTISNGTNTTITNLARTDFFNVFSVGQEIEGGLSVLDDVTAENLLAANKVSVGTSVLSQVDKTGRLRLSGSDFESTSEGALISLEGVDFGGIGNGGNLELLAGAGGIVSTNAQTNIGGLLTAPNFISTVATGTAPLTVNSVTRVDNLNVEFLNGQSEGYFLNTTQFGAANGVATLDGSAKIPISQIPDALIGAVVYQGTWNANANSPTLTSSVGNKGNYYTVTVAGNTILDGTGDWRVGDMVIFNGSIWEKIDNNHDVTSVFGRTGTVTAQNGDYNTSLIPEGINLYYTTARVNADAPNVTLAGENYLSLLGQQITANQINLASHVTGILSDGNLSSNVALKNIDNNFSASQSITNGSDTDIILRVNGLDATSEYISMGIRPNYGVITAGYTGVGNTGLMFRASESTEYDVMELTFDGNLDLKSGAYQVAGQTVIDNSRNYTGGSGTFSGKLSVSSSGLLNQFEINRTDAGSVNFDFKSESALSHRFVSVKNGRLEIRDDDDATIFEVNDNAETELYYNKLLKLTTTSSGIDVTGTVTADNFLGEVQGSANTTPLRLQGQNNQRGVYIGFSGTDDDNIVFGTEASGVDSDFLTVGRTSLNATFAETVTANNIFKKATQTLSGTTPTYNCSTSVNAKITLTGNTTATLTNLVDGMSGNFYVTQDGTGGHTLTLSPTPKVINGGVGVVTLTGTAGSTDIISWAYDGTTLYVTYGLNYN
jgi:hypothetical protein